MKRPNDATKENATVIRFLGMGRTDRLTEIEMKRLLSRAATEIELLRAVGDAALDRDDERLRALLAHLQGEAWR